MRRSSGASLREFQKTKNPNSKADFKASCNAISHVVLHGRWLKTDPRLRDGERRFPATFPQQLMAPINPPSPCAQPEVTIRHAHVPPETGLVQVCFDRPRKDRPEPYVTPDDAKSCWNKPGPVAGPFQAHLGDGSVVTYYWYRFADQPALLNADSTDQEREAMQARVEKLHRNWKKDRDYLPPSTVGRLADIDPALIVTPPPGLETGYVPIATKQAAKE
jgi:hypothetical protein